MQLSKQVDDAIVSDPLNLSDGTHSFYSLFGFQATRHQWVHVSVIATVSYEAVVFSIHFDLINLEESIRFDGR